MHRVERLQVHGQSVMLHGLCKACSGASPDASQGLELTRTATRAVAGSSAATPIARPPPVQPLRPCAVAAAPPPSGSAPPAAPPAPQQAAPAPPAARHRRRALAAPPAAAAAAAARTHGPLAAPPSSRLHCGFRPRSLRQAARGSLGPPPPQPLAPALRHPGGLGAWAPDVGDAVAAPLSGVRLRRSRAGHVEGPVPPPVPRCR